MDAFLTTASPLTLDGASGLISSFRAHHPGVPAYVLATDDLDPTRVTGEVLFVSDVCKCTPFALARTLDDTNQVVFALPFALAAILLARGVWLPSVEPVLAWAAAGGVALAVRLRGGTTSTPTSSTDSSAAPFAVTR